EQARSLIAALSSLAEHRVVISAPVAVKQHIDIWGAEPETLDVMRQLKHEFDPARALNPGRFAGHI
ncbi:MAG: FAD-linked oxidase C-terminal domain-containing protein, partial [Thermomicrobiales bacterium]